MDGLKKTKNNESRTVEVPFPVIVQELLDLAGRNPHGAGYHYDGLPDNRKAQTL